MDGSRIYFRSLPIRVYVAFQPNKHTGVAFSAIPGFDARTVQLSKRDYTVVTVLRIARITAHSTLRMRFAVPSDTWIPATAQTLALLSEEG